MIATCARSGGSRGSAETGTLCTAGRPFFTRALLLCALSVGCVTTTTPGSDPASATVRAVAQRDLGLDYLSQGNTAMAIRKLQRAAELDPENAEILLWLGEGYRRKDRLEDAQVYMEKALALSPKSHEIRLNLSGLYIQMERYDDAIAQADVLVEDATFTAPWQALNNRGWAQFQQGQLDAAEASFEEALDYSPRFWPSSLNLGILSSERGRKREAIEHFTQVLEREPDTFALAETNYRIGEVYVGWGHRERAIDHFKAAFENSPNSSWGEESKGYLDLLK